MNAPSRQPLPIPPHEPQPVPEDFRQRAAALGISISAEAATRLGDYLGRLMAMNEVVNLISRVDPANAWDRHILDSLTLVPQLAHLESGGRVLDVGSGGGLPGIPIAIARPDLSLTLLDATQKKVRFLASVVEAMQLTHVATHAGRAEQLRAADLGGRFDIVTARAVTKLAALVALTAPFLEVGGRLLLIKGQRAEDELAEASPKLKRQGLRLLGVEPTPTGRIVVFEKYARSAR